MAPERCADLDTANGDSEIGIRAMALAYAAGECGEIQFGPVGRNKTKIRIQAPEKASFEYLVTVRYGTRKPVHQELVQCLYFVAYPGI